MESPPGSSVRGGSRPGWPLSLIMGGLLLAAVGQVAYLAQWPLYVLGRPVTLSGALAIALMRAGIYTGLARGLALREPQAWSGTVAELARSFLFFLSAVATHGWLLSGPVYPAAWTQGVLSGALPLLVVVNSALAMGWKPGPLLDPAAAGVARVLAALCAIGALWLRRQAPEFGVPAKEHWRELGTRGLPVALAIGAAEALALVLLR